LWVKKATKMTQMKESNKTDKRDKRYGSSQQQLPPSLLFATESLLSGSVNYSLTLNLDTLLNWNLGRARP
jgi:hypothetical protein